MALFDDLMSAVKKALGDKARPTLQKAAEVMAEFEVGVELARQHGQALVRAAQEANEKAKAARPVQQGSKSGSVDRDGVVDVEVVEVEKK